MSGPLTLRPLLRLLLALGVLAAVGLSYSAPADNVLQATLAGKRADPNVIARALPDLRRGISDQASFDKASREAILTFAAALHAYEQQLNHLKPPQGRADLASIRKIIDRYWTELAQNYDHALRGSPNKPPRATSKDDLIRLIPLQTPHPDARAFYKNYLAEQLRIAALFPRISSEIDVYNENEITGDGFRDMEFLWSFDDGPSARNGNTDKLIKNLNTLKLHAVFFALGERVEARDKATGGLEALYSGQCLASHGQTHVPHMKTAQLERSLATSTAANKRAAREAALTLFRPPYGQRPADSGAFFKSRATRVVLWNIDSQDWRKDISQQDAADRVLALMLLKRKGIILFHDIHPKATTAVPQLHETLSRTKIKWLDCRSI